MKSQTRYETVVLACLITLAANLAAVAQTTPAVQRWGVFEASFEEHALPSGSIDIAITATFTQGGQSITVPGFWDGGDTFKIRFSPPAVGRWTFKTASDRPGLNGRTGSFVAVEPTDASTRGIFRRAGEI